MYQGITYPVAVVKFCPATEKVALNAFEKNHRRTQTVCPLAGNVFGRVYHKDFTPDYAPR